MNRNEMDKCFFKIRKVIKIERVLKGVNFKEVNNKISNVINRNNK